MSLDAGVVWRTYEMWLELTLRAEWMQGHDVDGGWWMVDGVIAIVGIQCWNRITNWRQWIQASSMKGSEGIEALFIWHDCEERTSKVRADPPQQVVHIQL